MNLQPLIDEFADSVRRHAIPGREGAYCRYPGQGTNPYGCADAANLLYTIGHFERNPEKRAAAIAELRNFQAPESGLFRESSHSVYHTTAHCIAALELFDVSPCHPLRGLDCYRTPQGIVHLLESLDWHGNPNLNGHTGAGVYAALFLTGHTDSVWKNAYFDWLREHCDPEYGFGRTGTVGNPLPAAYHLFDWFHYLFNHHGSNRPFPRVERLIDTCITLYRKNLLPESYGKRIGFWEIDLIFSLHRATRQTAYRFEESRELLREHGYRYLKWLCATPPSARRGWEDLHMVFGTACAVAELQLAFPGEFETDIPLKNVLDRRVFI